MIDLSTILLFSLAALALTATPGPDMLLLASRSAAQGRAAGFATWVGTAAGTYCHALAVALGLSQLIVALPVAYDVVRFLGAAYLLFLAWRAFTTPYTAKRLNEAPRKTHSVSAMFWQGLLTNILNPKMALFVLALFPQFLSPNAGSVTLQIMILASVLNAIGFFVNGAVILAASRASAWLAGSSKMKNLSQYLLGLVFVGLAARLAFDTQR